MNSNSNFRLIQWTIRNFTTISALNRKSHYDSLGVTPKATQADIKSAYYKLSMIYHPDKSKESGEASQKFRDISEAYEVLGNVKSRKLYDRGLYFQPTTPRPSYDATINKFHKSRDVRSRPPAPSGRTTVYDFDEWSKSHYGATFTRDMQNRRRQAFADRLKQAEKQGVKAERVVFLTGVMLLLIFYAFYSKGYDNPDNVLVVGDSYKVIKKTS